MSGNGQHQALPEPWRKRLYVPAYTVVSAARYAKTKPSTVSYWHRGGNLGPALPGKKKGSALNYFQLVEVAFVATFRSFGVSLQKLRRAHQFLSQVFEFEYPFAEKRLMTEGVHVLMDWQEVEPDQELGQLIIADAGGQLAWRDQVSDRFAEFDYERARDYDLAVVWHPAGRTSPVIIDPRISYGAPQIGGIPTWAVRGRRLAGESLEEIGEDFGLSLAQVRGALEFESVQLAA